VKWAAEHGIDTTTRYQSSKEGGPVVEYPNSVSAVTQPGPLMILAEKAGTPELQLKFELGASTKASVSLRSVQTTLS